MTGRFDELDMLNSEALRQVSQYLNRLVGLSIAAVQLPPQGGISVYLSDGSMLTATSWGKR